MSSDWMGSGEPQINDLIGWMRKTNRAAGLAETFKPIYLQTEQDFHKILVLSFSSIPLVSVKFKVHSWSALHQQHSNLVCCLILG